MSMTRFISMFAVAGGILPLIFVLTGWAVGKTQGIELKVLIIFQNIMLMLWPSSLMLLPTGSDESLLPFALLISIPVNIVFYAVIGTVVWYGLKYHFILVLLAAALSVLWWRLLTL